MIRKNVSKDLPHWLRELYPFQAKSLPVGTERMSYLDEGDPALPPLLLVHGNLAWSFLWRRVIPSLTQRFRVIAPDNIGSGLSSKPPEHSYHTIDRYIDNLTVLIESLELKNITLGMHGWGGPIGLGYAVHHPENVARIVLINSWAEPPHNTSQHALPLRAYFYSAPWNPRIFMRLFARRVIRREFLLEAACKLSRQVVDGYMYPFAQENGTNSVGVFSRYTGVTRDEPSQQSMEGIRDNLWRIGCPVEILWGVRSPLLRGMARPYLLRDLFLDGKGPFLLPNSAHFPPEDAPQAVIDRLLTPSAPSAPNDKPSNGSPFNILG